MGPKKEVFQSLNGLRGVAAIAVLLFHAQFLLGRQIVPRGYLAVDLFFALSGFVIAHAYDRRFASGTRPREFFFRRLLRFYPLYLSGLLLGAGWMFLELTITGHAVLTWTQLGLAVISGLLFLPVPFPAPAFPLNVPAWSLFCELVVNFVFATIWDRRRVLIFIAALSWVVLLAVSNGSLDHSDLPTGLLRAGYSFPVGVLLYRHRIRLPKLPPWAIIGAITPFFILPIGDMLAATFLFPAAIALLAQSESDSSLCAFLGRLSFPVYAVHYPILDVGLGLERHIPVDRRAQCLFWVCLAIVVAVAAEHLDKGIQRAIRRFSRTLSRTEAEEVANT